MNRIFSFAVLSAAILTATASPLTPDEALNRIQPDAQMRLGGERPELVMTGRSMAGKPTFYVFSTASRTIIASADDVAVPLLGYIDSGNFDPARMPPHMKSFLESYSAEIAAVTASGHIHITKAAASRAERQAIEPLCKTGWNQDDPYNVLCPVKNGDRTYTGCVATAMAQVMKYFSYPTKGSGSVSYSWNRQTLSLDLSATEFDWGSMLDRYDASSSAASKTAVATLMKACGYAVGMNYGTADDGGSGAPSIAIVPGLVNYLNYDMATDLVYRDMFTLDDWNRKIYDNIRNIGPVVYCGSSSTGGHAFVIDGYSSDDFFHVNWGWGNAYDGYFKLSALNPDGQGIGGYEGGYNYNQTAVVGMRKPVAGSQKPAPTMGIFGTLKAIAQGRTLYFVSEDGGIINTSAWPGNFIFGILLTDSGGSTSTLASDDLGTLDAGQGYTQLNVEMPENIRNGIYTVSLAYKVNGASDWAPIKGNGGIVWQTEIEVSDNGLIVLDAADGSITATDMTAGKFVNGLENTITVTFKNTGTTALNRKVLALICTSDGQSANVRQQFASADIGLEGRESGEFKFTGTVDSELTPGKYYLVFASQDYRETYSQFYDITVYDPNDPELNKKDPAEISLGDIVVGTGFAPGAECRVKAVVTGEGDMTQETVLTPVIARRAAGGLRVIASLESQSISLDKGETTVVEFSGTLPDDLSGSDYRFAIFDESNTPVNGRNLTVAIGPTAPYEIVSFTTADGIVEPDNARIELTVKASSKCDRQFTAFVGDPLEPTATIAFPQTTIAAGSTETLVFEGSIEGLVLGENYQAKAFTIDKSFIVGVAGASVLDFTFRKADGPDDALTTIGAEGAGEVRYYDILGRRLTAPARGAIIIRADAEGVRKIVTP